MKLVVGAASIGGLLMLGGPPGTSDDQNWGQWRGPDGLGVSPSTAYPDEWSPDTNVA